MLKSARKKSILVTICLAMVACHGYSATGGPGKTVNPGLMRASPADSELVKVNLVYVEPIRFDPNGRSAESLGGELYKEVVSNFTAETGMEVVGTSEVLKRYESGLGISELDPRGDLVRASGATGILRTVIHDYQERVGSRVGAETPARVDFTLSLIRVEDSKPVWQANFHFDDTALSDNWFRIKERFTQDGKPGWKAAKDLFAKGVIDGSRDLNNARVAQFERN